MGKVNISLPPHITPTRLRQLQSQLQNEMDKLVKQLASYT